MRVKVDIMDFMLKGTYTMTRKHMTDITDEVMRGVDLVNRNGKKSITREELIKDYDEAFYNPPVGYCYCMSDSEDDYPESGRCAQCWEELEYLEVYEKEREEWIKKRLKN